MDEKSGTNAAERKMLEVSANALETKTSYRRSGSRVKQLKQSFQAGNSNIQENPPPYPECSEELEHTFNLKDPEASREAELAQRYEKMNFLQRYVMEIIFMFFMFASMIYMIPQTQIFLEKACENDLHYNKSICEDINNKKNRVYHDEAAKITKLIGVAKDIVTTLPGKLTDASYIP